MSSPKEVERREQLKGVLYCEEGERKGEVWDGFNAVIPVIGGIEWTGEEGGLELVIRMNYRREEMHGRRGC